LIGEGKEGGLENPRTGLIRPSTQKKKKKGLSFSQGKKGRGRLKISGGESPMKIAEPKKGEIIPQNAGQGGKKRKGTLLLWELPV